MYMMNQKKKKKYSLYMPISTMNVASGIIEKLHQQGVKYTSQLLECGQTQHGREVLASETGLPLSVIMALVCRADLMRLRGVGTDISLLLVEAGVTSCRTLHQQDAVQLYKRLGVLHIKQRICYHAPSLPQVRSFIIEAGLLAATSPEL